MKIQIMMNMLLMIPIKIMMTKMVINMVVMMTMKMLMIMKYSYTTTWINMVEKTKKS